MPTGAASFACCNPMADSENQSAAGRSILPFAVTIFWGAFLLFLVQPLIGKYILPWFGGTPGVWTTCLLFFQCLLLGGYAYAHCLNHFFPIEKQVKIHGAMLAVSGGLMAIVTLLMTMGKRPIEWLQPSAEAAAGSPTLAILLVLLGSIGLPYLVLSATGPLVQAWFAKARPGQSPYRLYALSNVGSLLALLGFPFLFEPWISRTSQVHWWAFGMTGYAVMCGYLTWLLRTVKEPNEAEADEEAEAPSSFQRAGRWFLWLAFPACGTALLMATTNKMCQDVAVVPFLWVLPLALYLITFIISFDSPKWYVREIYLPLLIASWGGVVWVMFEGVSVHIVLQVVLFCLALFFSCMICHGELFRLRPEPKRLTQYFLGISAGGALGGLFVAVIAPRLFSDYWEYHIMLWIAGALFLASQAFLRERWTLGRWHLRAILTVCWMFVCLALLKYTFFSKTISFALIFGTLIGGWIVAMIIVKQWWPERDTSEMMELKAAGVATGGITLAAFWGLAWLTNPGEGVTLGTMWSELNPGLWVALALLFLNIFVWISIRRWKGLSIHWAFCLILLLPALVALGMGLNKHRKKEIAGAEFQGRNFYGTLKITTYSTDVDGNRWDYRLLQNGRITHGFQFNMSGMGTNGLEVLQQDGEGNLMADEIVSYYGVESGVGRAMELIPNANRRVGVVGLGVGTMAGFAQAGDEFFIYDINPMVVDLCEKKPLEFHYVSRARDRNATVELILGDARLVMEQEVRDDKARNLDLMVLDAFSSDAIPVHLLTLESLDLYTQHMNPDGIIAVHISNRYLNLEPVVQRLASEAGYRMVTVESSGGEYYGKNWIYACTWILLSKNDAVITQLRNQALSESDVKNVSQMPLWTDDHASIFQIMFKPSWWPGWLGGNSP